MPDVSTRLDGSLPLVQGSLTDTAQDTLGSGYLIRTHHHQVLIHRKHTILGEDIEQSPFSQESAGKVTYIEDKVVFCICPIAGELKRLRLRLDASFLLVHLRHMGKACGIGIVFGFRSVADEENLYIIVESAPCPKGIPFVAVDLVERLFQRHSPALQFAMHQRKSVHQDSHIIAVGIFAPFGHILVEYLHMVVVYILLVDELDVLRSPVVKGNVHNLCALDAFGLVLDGHLRRSDVPVEELLPFLVGKGKPVQALHLLAEVGNEGCFVGDVHPFVPLLRQLLDER